MSNQAKKLLARALRIARLLVSSDMSVRYSKQKKAILSDELRAICRTLGNLHGMSASSVWDQVNREAYRLPPLNRTRATRKRKGSKWQDTDYRFKSRYDKGYN
jgi:hypothetical protein